MSPKRLLKHFERIADAPDAVSRLRRFILDLAVRGKLVEQDPKDEPAERPLTGMGPKESAKDRQRSDPPETGARPFDVPGTWSWLRLGDIGDWGSGSTPPRGHIEYYGGGITWLKSGELGDKTDLRVSEETVTKKALDQCSFRMNKAGDVLIAMYGATIGKLGILAEDAVTNQAVCGCTPFPGVLNRYLFTFLLSQREAFRGQSEGGAQPNISKVKIVNTPFALPPLSEQHRIVAKVDELMGLCDELEAAQAKREGRRDRLVAATLHGLNNGASETETGMSFPETARFYFNHLPRLTTRPEHIQQLRQTILNLAVRGRLVPQDPKDEPASELLKKIRAGKTKIGRIGKPKESEGSEPVLPSDRPYAAPLGWEWIRLGEIVESMNNGIYKPSRFYTTTGTACVRMYNIQDGRLDLAKLQRLDLTEKEIEQYRLEPQDILINRVNSRELVGKAAIVGDHDEPLVFEAMNIRIRLVEKQRCPYFVNLLLRTKSVRELFQGDAKQAVGQASISQPQVAGIPTPIPPLAEQKRIVAKVDELMGLCDELETHLTERATTRRQLLEAGLAEALAEKSERTDIRRVTSSDRTERSLVDRPQP